jgi:hypothetical protein
VAGGEQSRWALGAGAAAAGGALGAWTVAAAGGVELRQAAVGLAAVAGLASYGIHRYELLVVGKLEEST